MSVIEQDISQDRLFDRVTEVVNKFADNPQTMWSIVVESLPVEFGDRTDQASTVVSGALIADYSLGSPYTCTAAVATFGTRRMFGGPFEKTTRLLGADWHEDDLGVPALGWFKSISEVMGSTKEGAFRTEVTERLRGDRRQMARVNEDSLVRTLREQGLPYPGRMATMYHKLVSTPAKWQETGITKGQHQKDLEAIKALISHAGVGRVAVSSCVPIELHLPSSSDGFRVADDEVEIDQEFVFEPYSKGFDLKNSPVGYNVTEKISISAVHSGMLRYEQEQGEMEHERKKTIGFDNTLEVVLDGLDRAHAELIAEPQVFGIAANGFHRNVPLAQQHSRRILRYMKSL